MSDLGRFVLRRLAALVAVATLAGCGPSAEEREAELRRIENAAAREAAGAVARFDGALADVQGMTGSERSALREFLNPAHLATARELGVGAVEDTAEVHSLARGGELVELEDSTDFWVVRDLTHSLPYVTPGKRAMLEELGRRFHARLDSLGVPPFRFEVTSVLRTNALQARLRRRNPNASRSTSSHEFGTTVDIAYNTFSAPAAWTPADGVVPPDAPERDVLLERVSARAVAQLDQLAEKRAGALKAILGRVLLEMQEEGKVRPLLERAQPVYHTTVASEYGAGGAADVVVE